jgi:hypothetical protein
MNCIIGGEELVVCSLAHAGETAAIRTRAELIRRYVRYPTVRRPPGVHTLPVESS